MEAMTVISIVFGLIGLVLLIWVLIILHNEKKDD